MAHCAECGEIDGYCPPWGNTTQFCEGLTFHCKPKRSKGELCSSDNACESGFCGGFKCELSTGHGGRGVLVNEEWISAVRNILTVSECWAYLHMTEAWKLLHRVHIILF
jgi:hypothetical protein